MKTRLRKFPLLQTRNASKEVISSQIESYSKCRKIRVRETKTYISCIIYVRTILLNQARRFLCFDHGVNEHPFGKADGAMA